MGSLSDALGGFIPAQPASEGDASIPQPIGITAEAQLTLEITDLWAEHLRLRDNKKLTARELRQVRSVLAEKLAEVKALLSCPGRGGQWRSWLRKRGIPRSTADGLIARHIEALSAKDGNVPTRAIQESANENPESLGKRVWSRAQKVLTTHEAVLQFITYILRESGVAYEQRDEGLMIFNAHSQAAEEIPVPAPELGPIPQPSDCSSTDTEPPVVDSIPLPAAEQAASTGETGIAAAV